MPTNFGIALSVNSSMAVINFPFQSCMSRRSQANACNDLAEHVVQEARR